MTSKGGTQGRREPISGSLTIQSERQDYLRALLLSFYQLHRGFFADWRDLVRHYERLLQALNRVQERDLNVSEYPWRPESVWGALATIIIERPLLVHLGEYRARIEGLCSRWGLRSGWAPSWVHCASLSSISRGISVQEFMEEYSGKISPEMECFVLSKALFQGETASKRRLPWLHSDLRNDPELCDSWLDLVPLHFRPGGDPSGVEASLRFDDLLEQDAAQPPSSEAEIASSISYDPLRGGDWAAIKARVLKQAKSQWAENRSRWLEAGCTVAPTRPSLRRHIHWLFLRVCPQPGYGRALGWSEIVASEIAALEEQPADWDVPLTATAVQKAVEPLAKELGLELPPLQVGPRPKFP